MSQTLQTAVLAAAFAGLASMASAVTTTPFDTPLSAGDSTNGDASADQFESYSMTMLSFSTATALRAEVAYTINPYSATPGANAISLAYSVNGGGLTNMPVTAFPAGPSVIGAGGIVLNLALGDTVSFFINGTAGAAGNLVDFTVETSAVPVLPAGALALTGIAALSAARRGRKARS